MTTTKNKPQKKKEETKGPVERNILKESVKNLLGGYEKEDWILNLNIGNVMHLMPIDLQELNLHIDNSHELSRDAILEKVRVIVILQIILIAVAYFCVGTEIRFLLQKRKGSEDDQVSKRYS
jgi:hypothetical protein